MKEIRIEKINLNAGTGGPGENMEKAAKLLEIITGRKPIKTKSKKRIPTWGVRPGLTIGCKVTIRGKEAEEMLKNFLKAKNNQLNVRNFDTTGNFSFGIPEYIDIPNIKYNHEIGIIGFEVAVTLCRPGYRIKRKMIKPSRVGRKHRISKEEAVLFLKDKFGVKVE